MAMVFAVSTFYQIPYLFDAVAPVVTGLVGGPASLQVKQLNSFLF